MRIRTIKPEFWASESLSALPEVVHMAAAALLNYADDEGYFNANPLLIKSAIFPIREPSLNIHGILSELSRVGYLRLGEGGDGRKYGHIEHFTDHQVVNRGKGSKIKGLQIKWERSVIHHGSITDESSGNREQGTGNGMEGNREGTGAGGVPDRPVELPAGFPKTEVVAREHAAFVGCPAEFADKVWAAAVSRGGKDARGQDIRSFRHHLSAAWKYEQERKAKEGAGGRAVNQPQKDYSEWKTP